MSPVQGSAETIDVGALLDEGRWSALAKMFVGLSALAVLLDGFDN